MIRKYHKHTLQTSPWIRDEEPQNIYINKTMDGKKYKAASFFSFKVIAKIEWRQNNA